MIDSKSDTDQQEEYGAIIPEAFLVEEEVEGEIIQATLIKPTPPWWKMCQAQFVLCFVLLLVLALSIYLGINKSKNKAGAGRMSPSSSDEIVLGAIPVMSISPSSSASIANVFSSPSPSSAPSCSLDSNCGAILIYGESLRVTARTI